jgi:tRNA pseudouridine38-40 synthase
MPRYALELTIDGRAFHGTALQDGHRTVHGVLRQALHRLDHGPVLTRSCGRLDAGVSAHRLIIHCHLRRSWAPTALGQALSAHLRPDAAVLRVAEVADDWDALLNCVAKTYAYRLYVGAAAPVLIDRCWWQRRLDHADRLDQCATLIPGQHSLAAFAALRKDGSDDSDPVRTYHSAAWSCEPVTGGKLWTFHIKGSGFLYKQVRGVVGAMVEVARGKAEIDDFAARIGPGRDHGQPCLGRVAPGEALALVQAQHDPDPTWIALT